MKKIHDVSDLLAFFADERLPELFVSHETVDIAGLVGN